MLSTLHSCSALGVKNDLELFDLPPTQFSHEDNEFLEFYPTAPKFEQSDSIEFHIPNVGKHYIDPSAIFLYVKARIIRADGTVIKQEAAAGASGGGGGGAAPPAAPPAEVVVPVDNFLNTLFQHVDIYFNQVLISRHEFYAYRSYLDLILKSNATMEKHTLWPLMYDRNKTPLQSITEDNYPRYKRTKDSKEFDGITPIFSDICQQGKLLLNGVDIRITLRQNTDTFRLMSAKADGEYKLDISKMVLYVRHVQISPSVLVAHEKRLQSQPALYAIRGVETKIRSIQPNSSDIYFENLCPERVPARLTVVFLKQSSFYGKLNLNPFHFENLGIQKAKVMIGGKEIINSFDFDKNLYAHAYTNLMRHAGNPFINITMDQYSDSTFILHYILTPDCSDEHFSIPTNENVRLHIQLKQPLTEAYTAILLTETPRIIEIDSKRNVLVK